MISATKAKEESSKRSRQIKFEQNEKLFKLLEDDCCKFLETIRQEIDNSISEGQFSTSYCTLNCTCPYSISIYTINKEDYQKSLRSRITKALKDKGYNIYWDVDYKYDMDQCRHLSRVRVMWKKKETNIEKIKQKEVVEKSDKKEIQIARVVVSERDKNKCLIL